MQSSTSANCYVQSTRNLPKEDIDILVKENDYVETPIIVQKVGLAALKTLKFQLILLLNF